MKHRIIVFCTLLMAACLMCGCDMFRALAGRPTSKDLEEMRAELAYREAAEFARQDSLKKVEARQKDSLAAVAALDSLRMMGGLLRSPSRLGGFSSTSPAHKYYVVLGSFKDKSNVERLVSRLNESGFTAESISFKTGMTSVGACPSDNPAEFLSLLRQIKADPVFPKDYWILVNE